MADSKISGLPAVSAFATTQEFPVNDSGTSRKITGLQVIAAVSQGTTSSAYAEVTANQGTFTAQTDLTGLTITVQLFASRRYRVSCKVGLGSSVAADQVQLLLIDTSGPTTIDATNMVLPTANAVGYLIAEAIIVPGAGSKTYKLAASRIAGTGNITMYASTTQKAHIIIEDIGT